MAKSQQQPGPRLGLWGAALALLLGGVLAGCQKEAVPLGPAATLEEFIATMNGVHGDPAVGEKAARLLWKPARDNLTERARRASALSGRNVALGEMIAPSWFTLQLVPERYETRLDGKWAEVTVISRDGSRAKSRLVDEDGAWRVALELPPLSSIRKRADVDERR